MGDTVVKRIKFIFTGGLLAACTFAVMLLLLEFAFRYQWFDFYNVELNALNSAISKSPDSKKILVFGDSFSAANNGYVTMLRDSLTWVSVVNSAVPGTCMREMSFIARNRIDSYKPDVLIVQLYPGNDLTDISHPVNYDSVSFLRNLYWLAVDNWGSLGWLNYKLAGVRQLIDREQHFVVPQVSDTFLIKNYSSRVKLLIKADRGFIANSARVAAGKYSKAFDKQLNYIKSIAAYYKSVKPDGRVVLLVVPHCSMVSPVYYHNYQLMGAILNEDNNSASIFTIKLAAQLPGLLLLDATNALAYKERAGG
ncbi:MAG TPA: hypothetical protein PLW44_07650, partial [Chitinophagales bacterium]|nr:hypothetical protein [Chitinophagales bacterium]